MLWINLLHAYQPANSDSYRIEEALHLSYERVIRALEKHHDLKLTINISACLVSRIAELNRADIIKRINKLIDKKQVELTGSAAYHALLPLVKEDEVIYQIQENEKILKKYFPRAELKGFFLPEMAYSPSTARIIKKMGYHWIILDEISYQGKRKIDFNKSYLDKKSGLKVLFRSRFFSSAYPPDKIKNIIDSDDVIITATDFELYGLRHLDHTAELEKMLSNNNLQTKLMSKYIEVFTEPESVDIRSSNWESSEKTLSLKKPFHLWYDRKNKIHLKLWKLADLACSINKKYKKSENYKWSRWHLNRGLASCVFWWASSHDFKENFGPNAWNPDEIERGTNELIRSIRSLEESTSCSEKLKAEDLFIVIKKMVWTRHWTYHFKSKK